jgi:LmbE family N-acetylglucosaminyl deacetylase
MAPQKKSILIVLAHPDDESFGMGGTIAHYTSQGIPVHLICATRGEAGTVEPSFLKKHKTIAALRESELKCAAKALGLTSVIFLDYRDSGMIGSKDNKNRLALINAPIDKVAAKIVKHIRKLKPQVVMTFDAVGGYHHPDHIAIHKATVKAFHDAGNTKLLRAAGKAFQPAKLYFTAINRNRWRWVVRMMRLTGKDPSKLGRNKDIDLTALTRDKDTPPHVEIYYRTVKEKKEKADACHASQLDGRFSRFSLMDLYWKLVGYRDRYTQAYPVVADSYRAKDLFAD